ncbi:MAG: alkaline phosphatase family protein [Novosphingobium sp.]|nr:alkaline phosphatase family protein [Novosphingobium sp.]
MKRLFAALIVNLLLLAAPGAAARANDRAPLVILISLDGFRPDYLDRGVTPNLSALAARGISAAMRPSFPTKTFPNHWTLVTGQRPDRHGIVGNRMEDPARPGEVFTMASDDPFWWNAASPIWIDAEAAGIRTATMFWPGSNVGWGGLRPARPYAPIENGKRPQDWTQFNAEVTATQRIETVLDWMRRPAAIRPQLVTLYFDTVDSAGHEFGPDDPRTTEVIATLDADLGRLIDGLRKLRRKADLVIVADHGMAAISSERTVALDVIADSTLFRLIESGPYASMVPTPGNEEKLAAAMLKPHEHMECWRREQIPERLAFGRNPRVPPLFCLAEPGWTIAPTAPPLPFAGGAHGYDQAMPEMAALFIAAGPHIRSAGTLTPFDNVDVEPLLRRLLGMQLDPDVDGSDAPFSQVLRK